MYSVLYLKEIEDTLRLIFITCIHSFILLVLLLVILARRGPSKLGPLLLQSM